MKHISLKINVWYGYDVELARCVCVHKDLLCCPENQCHVWEWTRLIVYAWQLLVLYDL